MCRGYLHVGKNILKLRNNQHLKPAQSIWFPTHVQHNISLNHASIKRRLSVEPRGSSSCISTSLWGVRSSHRQKANVSLPRNPVQQEAACANQIGPCFEVLERRRYSGSAAWMDNCSDFVVYPDHHQHLAHCHHHSLSSFLGSSHNHPDPHNWKAFSGIWGPSKRVINRTDLWTRFWFKMAQTNGISTMWRTLVSPSYLGTFPGVCSTLIFQGYESTG